MRLGGNARYLVIVASADELREALAWARQHSLRLVVVGGGSNIIWTDAGFDGLVIVNRITGFAERPLDDRTSLFTFGAGEDWDELVQRTIDMDYSGLELLSWIPGRAGATPVQNVGAYGYEIKDVLVSVDAIDTKTDQPVTIPAADCDFSYRSSRFNRADKGRFLITAITVKLSKNHLEPPFYASIQDYLDERKITDYTPAVMREAVITVRKKKLPDPDEVANNGSFFANPMVTHSTLTELQQTYPDIVYWPQGDDHVKLSAAWLIDKAGLKDYHDPETGMATWNKQPLVLINEHAQSSNDLLKFKTMIVETVEATFGITLQQEPELITG